MIFLRTHLEEVIRPLSKTELNLISGREEIAFVRGELLDLLGMGQYKTLLVLDIGEFGDLAVEGDTMEVAIEFTVESPTEVTTEYSTAAEVDDFEPNQLDTEQVENNGEVQREISKEKNMSFQCNICKKCVKSEKILKQHMRFQHTNDPSVILKLKEIAAKKSQSLKCTICEKLFNTRQIKNHFRVIHPEIPMGVKCDICNKVFPDVSHLNRHKKMVHEDLRKFQCNICDFKTKLNETLKEHIKKHADRWFDCEDCGYRTKRERDLYKHTCKPKMFSCEICGAKSASREALRQHRKRKHKLVNFSSYVRLQITNTCL